MVLGQHCNLVRSLQFRAIEAREPRNGEGHLLEHEGALVVANLSTSSNYLGPFQSEPLLFLSIGAFPRRTKKLHGKRDRLAVFGPQIVEGEPRVRSVVAHKRSAALAARDKALVLERFKRLAQRSKAYA